jgi:hypothetical protein
VEWSPWGSWLLHWLTVGLRRAARFLRLPLSVIFLEDQAWYVKSRDNLPELAEIPTSHFPTSSFTSHSRLPKQNERPRRLPVVGRRSHCTMQYQKSPSNQTADETSRRQGRVFRINIFPGLSPRRHGASRNDLYYEWSEALSQTEYSLFLFCQRIYILRTFSDQYLYIPGRSFYPVQIDEDISPIHVVLRCTIYGTKSGILSCPDCSRRHHSRSRLY